jgi:hypothetical protein
MTGYAIVAVPRPLTNLVGCAISAGVPITSKETDARTYFCVPIFMLSGRAGLFEQPLIEVHHFWSRDAAIAWVERDIARLLATRGAVA